MQRAQAPRRRLSRHEEALIRAGLSVLELAKRCGLTKGGARKCLIRNTAPKNPLVAAPYWAALGLPAAPVPKGRGQGAT
jgi:hypothetical protein